MDSGTGLIMSYSDWEKEENKKRQEGELKEVKIENLPKPKQVILRKKGEVKIGRNDLCPCGSGKKFKRCCLDTGRAALKEVEGGTNG